MPNGKRTDRISERDLEVLEFVARFGVVPRNVVASWAGTGRAVTAARERRLRERGLVEVLPAFGDSGQLVICSRRGLRAVFRADLPIPKFSPGSVRHTAEVARVGTALEREGVKVLSEREIRAAERIAGQRIYSASMSGRSFHRPDIVAIGELVEVIEVELSAKAPNRLDSILRAWRRAVLDGKATRVRYFCADCAVDPVRRSVVRTRTEQVVSVYELPVCSESSSSGSASHSNGRPSARPLPSIEIEEPTSIDGPA